MSNDKCLTLATRRIEHGPYRRLLPGTSAKSNAQFTLLVLRTLLYTTFTTWLVILLLCSGDVHPNPGPPVSTSSTNDTSATTTMSATIFDSLPFNHNLSFVHYNVQSIYTKLELLQAELTEFDILAFSETWLNHSVDTDDLILESYQSPERKDRGDNHGGVIIYVKEGIYNKRRNDLEIQDLEAIWIEVANTRKHILFGLFYRPPNSNANYYSMIEDSLSLAVDTNISDIIVTGDFNFNLLNPRSSTKISSLCTQFSFFQAIEQPTHFTENSSSVIDIILVSSKDNLILSGVGDPFLNQDIRYHCPIYGIFKFTKPKCKTFKRHIWNYERGNYDLLRSTALLMDWDSLQDNNVDTYSENIAFTILSIAKECIPNRQITIRPSEPPWITTEIKRKIRKRKRAYRKAKSTGLEIDWRNSRKCEIVLSILYVNVRKPSMTSLHLNLSQNHFPQKTAGLL